MCQMPENEAFLRLYKVDVSNIHKLVQAVKVYREHITYQSSDCRQQKIKCRVQLPCLAVGEPGALESAEGALYIILIIKVINI